MVESLFKWYLDNQSELIKEFDGKVLVIKDNKVVSSFNTEEEAYFDSLKKYEPGTFIIQKCSPGDEAYTQTFHSRVIFA